MEVESYILYKYVDKVKRKTFDSFSCETIICVAIVFLSIKSSNVEGHEDVRNFVITNGTTGQ